LETYAPTTSLTSVFLLINLVGKMGATMAVADVSSAFLEGTAEFQQFCRLPTIISKPGTTNERVEILGNVYGEKQAPLVWNVKLDKSLKEIGLIRSGYDFAFIMADMKTNGLC
jgi:hypothetical protein